MTDDRSLERAARSFIESGPTRAPEHAVEVALLRIQTTSQERAIRIPWRFPTMTRPARLMALAVVGALVLAGLALLGGTGGSRPSPSEPTSQAVASASAATSSPSASPSPSPTVVPVRVLPESGRLTPGRYVATMPDAPVDAEFTIGSGFPESGGWWVGGGISSISFWTVENVYTDACIRLGTLPDPPIGPTVDDLVAALGAQASTEMSAPVDVEVGGHQGVRVELTPGDGLPANCGPMYMWKSPTNPMTQPEGDPGRGIERDGVGEHVEPVWILDVDGERVVIVAYNAGHRPSAGDLTDPVMESMTLTKH